MNEDNPQAWWKQLPNYSPSETPNSPAITPWHERLNELRAEVQASPSVTHVEQQSTDWWEQPSPHLTAELSPAPEPVGCTESLVEAQPISQEAAMPVAPDSTVLRRLSHSQLAALATGNAALYRPDVQFLPDWPTRCAAMGSVVVVHPYLFVRNNNEV